MLTRERPRMPARALMPPPARLPSLSDALARRAAIFGPFDLDEAPAPSLGLLAQCAAAARGAVRSFIATCDETGHYGFFATCEKLPSRQGRML